jgi:hypothetical protein
MIWDSNSHGEEYRKFHGSRVYLPAKSANSPSSEFVKWHNENKFKG